VALVRDFRKLFSTLLEDIMSEAILNSEHVAELNPQLAKGDTFGERVKDWAIVYTTALVSAAGAVMGYASACAVEAFTTAFGAKHASTSFFAGFLVALAYGVYAIATGLNPWYLLVPAVVIDTLVLGSMIMVANFIGQFVYRVAKPAVEKVGGWLASAFSWMKAKAQGAWSWVTGLFRKEALTADQQAEFSKDIDALVVSIAGEAGASCTDPIIRNKLRDAVIKVVQTTDAEAAKKMLEEAIYAYRADVVAYHVAMEKATEVNLDQPGINPIRGKKKKAA
jgi:hypothetical protein